VELKEYKELTVPYHEPEVTDEDVTQRVESIRERKAEYVTSIRGLSRMGTTRWCRFLRPAEWRVSRSNRMS